MKSLAARKAYVSAGSRGLAFQIAKRLASEGAAVALSSRSEDNLRVARENILRDIPDASVLTVAADLSNREDQARTLRTLEQYSFSPDIFVCSAGQPPNVRVPNISRDVWDRDVEMILGQAMFSSQHFAPAMARRKYGRILFISSVFSKGGNWLTSSVTRAGLAVLSRALVEEYACDRVASFVMNLGYVDTALLRNMALGRAFDAPDPETEHGADALWRTRYRDWAMTIPARRIGTPEELAELVLFLASPAAEYLNGSVLDFAGGLTGGTL